MVLINGGKFMNIITRMNNNNCRTTNEANVSAELHTLARSTITGCGKSAKLKETLSCAGWFQTIPSVSAVVNDSMITYLINKDSYNPKVSIVLIHFALLL